MLDQASGAAPATVNATANISGLAPGNYNATITISAGGASNSPQQVSVSLIVNPIPVVVASLSLNPTAIIGPGSTSGTVSLSSTAPLGGATVSLASDNPAVQVPSTVTVSAGFVSGPFTVATSAVSAQITGTVTGTYNGVSTMGALTVNPGVPAASLSGISLKFGPQIVGTASQAQTLTFTNAGTGALNINSITMTGDFSQTNSCGAQLGVGSNCSIAVTSAPTLIGPIHGTLSIADNAPGSPHVIGLSGFGDKLLLLLRQQRPARSGAQIISAGAAARIKFDVLTNATAGRMSFSCASPTPSLKCEIEPPTAILSGSQVTVDILVTDNPTGIAMLASGPAASTGGLHRYDLQVTATMGSAAETVAVPVVIDEPNRREPLHSVSQSSVNSAAKVQERADDPGQLRFAVPESTDVPKGREITGVGLSEEKVDFGEVSIGTVSVAREITLKNPQSIPITIEEMKATTEFLQVNTCSPELKPGESCKVVITFRPVVVGKKSGRLIIKTSGRTMIVNLTGTAQ